MSVGGRAVVLNQIAGQRDVVGVVFGGASMLDNPLQAAVGDDATEFAVPVGKQVRIRNVQKRWQGSTSRESTLTRCRAPPGSW